MRLHRVDDLEDGSVYVELVVEPGDGSTEELEKLAETSPSEFWARSPLVAEDPSIATKLMRAQQEGREYHLAFVEPPNEPPVPDPTGSEDYFDSYNDVEVHRLMLSDRPRTESYRRALESLDLEGKSVLDVGSGTGILALSASRAGARKVHAVEAASRLAEVLQKTAEKNKADVEVHCCRAEDLQLQEKVDVIVSEWMGFYLLHESMLESVLTARDRFLKPGGLLVPSTAVIYMALASVPRLYDERVTFWDDVYSFDMSAVKDLATEQLTQRPLTEYIDADSLLSTPQVFKSFDLAKLQKKELARVENTMEFTSTRDAQFHAICCFFEVKLAEGVTLSTAPAGQPTHWKQSLFMLGKARSIRASETVTCKVEMVKSQESTRQYSIVLSLD